jgi:osmoprotectant transport system permease protein
MIDTVAFLGQFGDAIEFLFSERQTRGGGTAGGKELLEPLWEHVKLSLAGMGVACAVAVPLGLWLGHIGKGSFFAISISNIGRAVPSLALIVFFFAYLGAGYANVTLALALLAIPPILTNTYVGVRQVDREAVDAGRGMGMTGFEMVRRVEFPLAAPLMFAGIRTAAVNVVATATIAPLAGVVTLGDPIISVRILGEEGRLAAAMVVAALAVVTELSLGWAERAVTPKGLKLEAGTPSRQRRLLITRRRVEATP